MGTHDFVMEDSKRVIDALDTIVESFKKSANAIDIMALIGKMDLAIDGLDKGFALLPELIVPIEETTKLMESVKEKIEETAAEHERRNSSFEF